MNNETVEANSPKMETVFDDKNLLNINKYLGESGFGRFEKTGFVTITITLNSNFILIYNGSKRLILKNSCANCRILALAGPVSCLAKYT